MRPVRGLFICSSYPLVDPARRLQLLTSVLYHQFCLSPLEYNPSGPGAASRIQLFGSNVNSPNRDIVQKPTLKYLFRLYLRILWPLFKLSCSRLSKMSNGKIFSATANRAGCFQRRTAFRTSSGWSGIRPACLGGQVGLSRARRRVQENWGYKPAGLFAGWNSDKAAFKQWARTRDLDACPPMDGWSPKACTIPPDRPVTYGEALPGRDHAKMMLVSV